MHKGEHHELQHHHFRLKFTELNEIYIFQSLRSLAFTFIAHFIPIYLLLTYNDIKLVFIYYAISYGGKGLIEPFIAKLIRHFGPKHIITACVPFSLFFLFMMQTLEVYHWPIYLIAGTVSLMLSLFWQAYHYDFSRAKRKKKAASDVTKQFVIVYGLAIIAPILGGFMMDVSGPLLVFSVSIGLMLLGTLALFRTSDKHEKTDKIDLKKLDFKCIRKDMISFAGYSVEGLSSMAIWPLFIYMIIGNYSGVGAVVSYSLLISAIIMYFVGKRSDKNPEEKMKYLRYGAVSKGLVEFGKIFIRTIPGVYVANTLKAIAGSFFTAPWTSEYYLHADEESRSEYMLVMEMSADFSRAIVSAGLVVLAMFVSLEVLLIVGLIIGGVASIFSSVMPPAKCEAKLDMKDFKVMPQPAKRGAK